MLLNLHVKNLALIRESEVEFGPGLNILTGETGAGKSILLGSVQLALGGKMSREMIREHADYGLVELLFSVDDPRVEEKLKALDVYPEEGQVLLTRRVMENRSVCRINGETCTMARMKQAASYLLDIHGQHEHQSLLYKNKQLDILDDFGKNKIFQIKEKVSDVYHQYTDIKKQLSAQAMDEEQRKREVSFLEFEINEIEEAALVPGEDEELEQQYRKLNNSRRIVEALQTAHGCTGYESPACAGELVGQALRCVAGVSEFDPQIESLESMLGDIDGLLNDFNRELSSYMESLTFEEEDFYQLEQRLDLINNLKAKYGSSIEQIKEYQQKQQEKLEFLQEYEANRARMEEACRQVTEQLEAACQELTKARRECASELEKEIVLQLQDLNFLDVKFEIRFDRAASYSANGVDDVEYQISTNPGEPMKPLGKVVSGGELSRIMLAIKTLLADKDEVGTLIFDEIDTGISGRTAQMVSEKMERIGRKRQVLCITHLPQIASMADCHFVITKNFDGQETVTKIEKLSQEDSVRELARLLGGAEITDKILESANEMKLLAQKQKNTRLHS
ncbi:MAG: DNA repair protein RecN [Eubacteriales bacterium]|nr:DNA repair protein RecN [Eubacteriales bacterium]